jgi:uncharacterized membrane protein
MRAIMAVVYAMAGVLHLVVPDKFMLIVPDWVPFRRETILLTGLCELAGSVALLFRPTARLAGVMLALYAVCVYPANIKHGVEGTHVPGLPDGWWYHGPRLALQPILVWWSLFCAGVVDWPMRPRGRSGAPFA